MSDQKYPEGWDEHHVLGVRRRADVPGFEIPARYFQFVRTGDAGPLAAVLDHNRLDLLSEFDARTDEEWIAADEAAAVEGDDQAVITVPAALLPEIRRLLASHKTV